MRIASFQEQNWIAGIPENEAIQSKSQLIEAAARQGFYSSVPDKGRNDLQNDQWEDLDGSELNFTNE